MTQSQEARILIVDSEPQTSKILSCWLEAGGYECVIAGDVDEASERLEQGGFSVVLADIAIPEKSGLEWVAKIKEGHSDVAVLTNSPLRRLRLRETRLWFGIVHCLDPSFPGGNWTLNLLKL